MATVPVELNKILISETGGTQVIVLREQKGARLVPIWIGMPEALAIHRKVQGEAPPRPMTHDLLADAIGKLGGKVTKILIDQFVSTPTGGTFHAKIVVQQKGDAVMIDARPSDAVALAIRVNAPIYIEESILKEEGRDPSQPRPEEEAGGGKEGKWDAEAEDEEGGEEGEEEGGQQEGRP